MTERGILFSAPMVRALLDGSKTQTRRAVKRQPWASCSIEEGNEGESPFVYSALHGAGPGYDVEESRTPCRCPYGQPDDRLWVRESFWGCDLPGYGDTPCVVYDDEWAGKEYQPAEARPWARKFGRIPSIHMPREASRILLEITGVRVERLQAISEADAIAEGIEQMPCAVPDTRMWRNYDPSNGWTPKVAIPQNSYRSLWDSINGADSWDANPWVWVVEFRRVES